MRVAIHRQGFGFGKPAGFGGMETQQAETIKWLERLGVEIVYDWTKAKVVHFFGVYGKTPMRMAEARSLGKKIVLSTVYWTYKEMHHPQRRMAHHLRQFHWAYHEADLLLPNSHAEAALISGEFQVPKSKMRVVVNAVPPDINEQANGVGLEDWEICDMRDYILIVGRNEGRKNQFRFLSAMRDVDVPILMVGDCHYEHDYYWACWEMAQKRHARTEFFMGIPPPRIYHYMKGARLVAQPSIYETPGLAVLEAAALGVPVAPTNRGSAREYFGNAVYYIDPFTPESMQGCLKATATDTAQIQMRMLQNYTWEIAGRQTMNAYKEVLGRWL